MNRFTYRKQIFAYERQKYKYKMRPAIENENAITISCFYMKTLTFSVLLQHKGDGVPPT
jgi:hypothetical protein